MMVGYHFAYEKDKTPYDFLDDPERPGYRIGENIRKASGSVRIDLTNGINHATLPPLEIWRRGLWYVEMTEEQKKLITYINPDDEYGTWITEGQGTPGNYLVRAFLLPDAIASTASPKHPAMWPKKLKETKPYVPPDPVASPYQGFRPTGFSQPTPAAKPPVKVNHAPALPAGIRMRCVGCGHWFKESTLAPHNSHCCPVLNDGIVSDWVIMCECCLTLDEIGACKKGFPRKPKTKEVVAKTEKDAAVETAAA